MTPSLGRIVHYTLTVEDARRITHRRRFGDEHVGTPVAAGDVAPAMIVKVNADGSVNLQVFLDGNHVRWVAGVAELAADAADPQGAWFEPPRVGP